MQKGTFQTNCPICNNVNAFALDNFGKMIACPTCGNLFVFKNRQPVSILCPSCQEEVMPGNVICLECGYSFETGEKVKEHIEVYGENFSTFMRLLNVIVDFFPGLFKISTLITAFLALVVSIAMVYFSFVLLALGAAITFFFFSICALYVYANGVAFILTGEVQMLQSAYPEMTGNKWSLFLFLVITPPVSMFVLVFTILSKIT